MFLDTFSVKKPVFGMLHFKGDSRKDKLERCLREAEIYRENGVDTVSYMRKTPAGAAFGYKSWTGFACDVAANDWVLA